MSLPGDLFVVRTHGWAARAIQVFTNSWANHAGIVTDNSGATVEAQPQGAEMGNLSTYAGDRILVGSPVELTSQQRAAISTAALRLQGTPYSWLDIVSLALLQLHIRPGFIRRRVARQDRLICSQLVDLCYLQAGVHLFSDGRDPSDVTPGDLANLLTKGTS